MGKGIDVDRGQKDEAISDPGESETTAPGKSRDTEEEIRTEESQLVVPASDQGRWDGGEEGESGVVWLDGETSPRSPFDRKV